jgi:outer membrane lipoprotein-sorting protein
MSEPRADHDLVEQAIAATRQLPLPNGPSEAIALQTLAALRAAARRPQPTFLQRVTHMPWTSKAVTLLATAASLLAVYVGLSGFAGGALAFADVVDVLNKVRSATWKTTTEVKGPQNETVKWTGIGMFLAPSHERMETIVQTEQTISIRDGQKDKLIILVPASKTAMIIDVKNLPPDRESPFGKTFEGFRALISKAQDDKASNVERLGVETIDGRPAQGFRLKSGAVEVKIWADAKSSLPIRIEQSMTTDREHRTVMTDFQINVDLDESLFRLEVPSGYTVQQTGQLDVSRNPIHFLADTLKMVAELNDGVFPPTLRGEEGIDGILKRSAKTLAEKYADKDGKTSLEQINKLVFDLSMKVGATFGFVTALSPDENDWHYAGKGVKLDTPNRPIFWYRRNKESATYDVLYADLSVKVVSAADVLKTPDAAGDAKR